MSLACARAMAVRWRTITAFGHEYFTSSVLLCSHFTFVRSSPTSGFGEATVGVFHLKIGSSAAFCRLILLVCSLGRWRKTSSNELMDQLRECATVSCAHCSCGWHFHASLKRATEIHTWTAPRSRLIRFRQVSYLYHWRSWVPDIHPHNISDLILHFVLIIPPALK